jgi:hypothetical protein
MVDDENYSVKKDMEWDSAVLTGSSTASSPDLQESRAGYLCFHSKKPIHK